MKKIILTILVIAMVAVAQSDQLKPRVADNGGGLAKNPELTLISSIGQAVSGPSSGTDNLQAGYISLETLPSDIHDNPAQKPDHIKTDGFFPNPFNSSTAIKLDISRPGNVYFDLFDVLGKRIYSWNGFIKGGEYNLVFTPESAIPSGVYLYTLKTSNEQKSGKLSLIK